MQVTLINQPYDPLDIVYRAAKCCTSTTEQLDDVFDNTSFESKLKLVDRVIKSGHTSVLEHISYTFLITGVSRAMTHQLVRTRMASYSQQSQRYVDLNSTEFVTPDSIQNNPLALKIYQDYLTNVMECYTTLQSLGIPNEDSRFVLPNACTSNIVVTENARALLNTSKTRLCKRAQWEIRTAYLYMIKSLPDWLQYYMRPNCGWEGCTEQRPCDRGGNYENSNRSS